MSRITLLNLLRLYARVHGVSLESPSSVSPSSSSLSLRAKVLLLDAYSLLLKAMVRDSPPFLISATLIPCCRLGARLSESLLELTLHL